MKTLTKIVSGIILTSALFFGCENVTTTKGTDIEEPETPTITYGNVQGRVVVPVVEDNSWSWKGKENVTISIDGVSKGKSIADGLFYISGIETGARELMAGYMKQFLSEKVGVFVQEDKINTLDDDVKMTPTSDENEIVHGIIYADSTKSSRYNGRLRLTNNSQQTTYVSDGVYAFQGLVDDQDMMADINPGISARRVKFFDKQNPSKESWQIDLGDNWIREQNGYVCEF